MTKDEFMTSIEDFKKNVAESIISSEESYGLEWGSQSITIISVCVRTDCTVFDIERRRRFRRQSRGDEISVNYEVSVPNGMAASLLAQTMGDPSTVAAFETRMSDSTGKPVSARYDAMPAVAEAPPPLQSAPLFHHTPGGIVVIASSVLLLAAMLFYECLRRSAPRAFTKNQIKCVPPMHFSISMQQDLRHTSLEIFKSGLAHDLAAATGLDPKQILVVGVKRGAFLAVVEALMAKTPEKIAHDDREKSSAQPAESAEEDHHRLKKTLQKLILGNRVQDNGSLIAVAEIHLLYSADNGKVLLRNSTPKPCSDDKIDTVVHDLITQSKRLESVLMTGKWTRWTTQINDSRSALLLYEQVASEFELHQEGPKEKNGIAIADWEVMHVRLKRWTARGRVTAQNSRASHEDSNVPSFQALALVEKRPTTTSGRPSSAFLTSGFNFNHLTQEKRFIFGDGGPEVGQVVYAHSLRQLLSEAQHLTDDVAEGAATRTHTHTHKLAHVLAAEYKVDVDQDFKELVHFEQDLEDPEPFSKMFVPDMKPASSVLQMEPASMLSVAPSHKPASFNSYNFFNESSIVDGDDIKVVGGFKKKELGLFEWTGLEKERMKLHMWEDFEPAAVDEPNDFDKTDMNKIFQRLSSNPLLVHDCPSNPLGSGSPLDGPSEIQDLIELLQYDSDDSIDPRGNLEVECEPYIAQRYRIVADVASDVPLKMLANQITEEEMAKMEQTMEAERESNQENDRESERAREQEFAREEQDTSPVPHSSAGIAGIAQESQVEAIPEYDDSDLGLISRKDEELSVSVPAVTGLEKVAGVGTDPGLRDHEQPQNSHSHSADFFLRNFPSGAHRQNILTMSPRRDDQTSVEMHEFGFAFSPTHTTPLQAMSPQKSPIFQQKNPISPQKSRADEVSHACGSDHCNMLQPSAPHHNTLKHTAAYGPDTAQPTDSQCQTQQASSVLHPTSVLFANLFENFAAALPSSRPMTGADKFGTTPSERGASALPRETSSARGRLRFGVDSDAQEQNKKGAGPLTRRIARSRPNTSGSMTTHVTSNLPASRPRTQGSTVAKTRNTRGSTMSHICCVDSRDTPNLPTLRLSTQGSTTTHCSTLQHTLAHSDALQHTSARTHGSNVLNMGWADQATAEGYSP